MPSRRPVNEEETAPLTRFDELNEDSHDDLPHSRSTSSTASVVFDALDDVPKRASKKSKSALSLDTGFAKQLHTFELDDGEALYNRPIASDRRARKLLGIVFVLALLGWSVALFGFVSRGTYQHASTKPHDPAATSSRGSGKKVTLSSVLGGQWYPKRHEISWIAGPNGEDGLVVERGEPNKPYLVVEDVRNLDDKTKGDAISRITLMKDGGFYFNGNWIVPDDAWPSPDFKKVFLISSKQKNWRWSYSGFGWIFDVQSQTAEPVDPNAPFERIKLAHWAPTSDAVSFTRNNNMFIRHLSQNSVRTITTDGGRELFYGIPDWVYEEEVFSGHSATWWSEDGNFIAFLRTNESEVPEYPVQYFVSRPSGKDPSPGEENYPDVRRIKYPKAGSPNPVVHLVYYDVRNQKAFTVNVPRDFPDNDRLITEVLWAGQHVLIRETNRVSDKLKMVLVDMNSKTAQVVREVNVASIDNGWFEVSHATKFIPADPANGRLHDGYIDTVIHEGFDHLGYFTPLNATEPVMLTKGPWEVVDAPSAVDLNRGLVYFVATKRGSTQRFPYSVKLDGSGLTEVSDATDEISPRENQFYVDVSFSTGAGYYLMSYQGPNIPWQAIWSSPGSPKLGVKLETNEGLARNAAEHELPIKMYETLRIDGMDFNVVERRPPHFNPNKKYPVLFYLYGGPGSQEVNQRFSVDFQSYIASNLGYVVVTIDGRGTGFIGRKARVSVRGNLGYLEASDQISAAKEWASRKYIDEEKVAIWGWSYGGFLTLKTLEQDAGQTFKYGMAVAPVTDWRFYDSIYTERYMHTPDDNYYGYFNASVKNATALSQNVRFLIMHGTGDDNVHIQNTLTLLDKLDLAGVENYDVHVFPDSDHGIYFHNANAMVYDRLNDWLVNAFNGEWLRAAHPTPKPPFLEKRGDGS